MREKEVIKEIAELEKLLPLIQPLDSLQANFKVLKAEKDALGKQMNSIWTQLDVVNS